MKNEDLRTLAQSLAREHSFNMKKYKLSNMKKIVRESHSKILDVHHRLSNIESTQMPLFAGSEWILDNIYKIEEHIEHVIFQLKSHLDSEIGVLSENYLAGFPRIYSIAFELVDATDANISEDIVIEFIKSYQLNNILNMCELWLVSLVFKVALIEKIGVLCEDLNEKQDEWEKIEEIKSLSSETVLSKVGKELHNRLKISPSYIEHLIKTIRLRPEIFDVLVPYLEEKLLEYDSTIDDMTNLAHNEQSILRLSMGNAITSLGEMSMWNWDDIFESLSIVEKILREDPSNTYSEMDFESRNYYRKKLQRMSAKIGVNETKVALRAIECAKLEKESGMDKLSHVGYYIVGNGSGTLLEKLGYKKDFWGISKHPFLFYTLPLTIFIVLACSFFFAYAYGSSKKIIISFLAVGITLIPTSEIFIRIINCAYTLLTHPSFLPKIEYRGGVTENSRTLVATPVILSNKKRASEIIDSIETNYIANREENLYFALLGEPKDANEMTLEDDKQTIEYVEKRIKRLNKKYSKGEDIFFYFQRKRIFNKSQSKWMGWERKRGSITELNKFLMGEHDTTHINISRSSRSLVKNIKYIIVLDADTVLPLGAAKKLIGTISHPLNKPFFDEKLGRVVEGYGLIQPNIGINLKGVNITSFSSVYSGHAGVDPYSCPSSNVYQDLFGKGTFVGKGIYDLEVFHSILSALLPENRILSHDLLEGNFVSTGLASDIELFDDYPLKYTSYIMRLHRWIRGDWQIAKWIMPSIRDELGRKVKNPLSTVSKWKIFDNLRRSLIEVSLFSILVLGFTVLPGDWRIWTFLVLGEIFLPLFLEILTCTAEGRLRIKIRRFHCKVTFGIRAEAKRAILKLVFLPYETCIMLNAISKTIYRLLISKKNLLEWTPISMVEKKLENENFNDFIFKMKSSPVLAGIFLSLIYKISPKNVKYAFSFAVLWAFAPIVAYFISKKRKPKEKIPPKDIRLVREIARRTWAYYEDFACSRENFLPPDNYQEYPPKGIAHRTSPTNIGLSIAATVSARDFGYISTGEMVRRIEKIMAAVGKLEQWRGHLYNWYDTRSLSILRPAYVSTVDSGNFVSYLICTRQALEEYIEKPLVENVFVDGVVDTLECMEKDATGILNNLKKPEDEYITVVEWKAFLERLDFKEFEDSSWGKRLIMMNQLHKRELKEFFSPFETIGKLRGKEVGSICEILGKAKCSMSLIGLHDFYTTLIFVILKLRSNTHDEDVLGLLSELEYEVKSAKVRIDEMVRKIKKLCAIIDNQIKSSDFSQLYDSKKELFSIGYDVDNNTLTKSYYDLLASEARQTSYIAIALGYISPKNWLKLSRSTAFIGRYTSLLSWGGTMFEYLMPTLAMRKFDNTVLDETYKSILNSQIDYAKKNKIPWGMSESAYYMFDPELNYQYKAFGIPELALKRGLGADKVVSPYSTLLALSVSPKKSLENLRYLLNEGALGEYGLFEAIDYTISRIPHDTSKAVIKTYMVHHQGMGILAIDNFINDMVMQKRFHSHFAVKSAEILLQEKIPAKSLVRKRKMPPEPMRAEKRENFEFTKVQRNFSKFPPCVHILSNGKYSVLLNERGQGYSKFSNLMLTRWKEGFESNQCGMHIFIRNIKSSKIWSVSYGLLSENHGNYESRFSLEKAEFIRNEDSLTTHLEVTVSPTENIEVRRLSISNEDDESLFLELTSYMETVLGPHSEDTSHPAFGKLFVETEFEHDCEVILASRRPKSSKDERIWAFHTAACGASVIGATQYETSRPDFIGRGKSFENACAHKQLLTGTTGGVLDPIMSLRKTIMIPARQKVQITYILGVSQTREGCIESAKNFKSEQTISQTFQLSATKNQFQARFLGVSEHDINIFHKMLPHIIYHSPQKRNFSHITVLNSKGQDSLWGYSVSGDYPIVLVRIKDIADIENAKLMLRGRECWRMKGLRIDIIFLDESEISYLGELGKAISDAVSLGVQIHEGIYIINSNSLPPEDKVLFYSVASIVIDCGTSIEKQLVRKSEPTPVSPYVSFEKCSFEKTYKELDIENLEFFNGYGGFTPDGDEYVIMLKSKALTPAPWINVIANEKFGFTVSESGGGCTWARNSKEFRITPWSNDPITDMPGEVIYIRDEDCGKVWCITRSPVPDDCEHIIRHGQGYSIFEKASEGIDASLTLFVPLDEPVKISLLKLKNISGKRRRLSILYYVNPVLSDNTENSHKHIISMMDKDILKVKNPNNYLYPSETAFITSSAKIVSYTADVSEFVGRFNDLSNCNAFKLKKLSGNTGSELDPCCAIQLSVELEENEESEMAILLGSSKDEDIISKLSLKYNEVENAHSELERAKNHWKKLLNKIQVRTPDRSMDIMLNGWIAYQTIACRLFARTAFYQSSGAYGFRDQLQDAANISMLSPFIARKQILLHCRHQFKEGDALHWWHKGDNARGIRSRIADDHLWLVFSVCKYIETSGDHAVLHETVGYVEGDDITEGETENFFSPEYSLEKSTVYEHCKRAIEKSLEFGKHGIPLMGSGDWNDGMNEVGVGGKGESVWLGWFMCHVLKEFSDVAESLGDSEYAEKCSDTALDISNAIEKTSWDGEWYKRAYFDDGTPLGSVENSECSIDSIAQSWAVISRMCDVERAKIALKSLDEHLIDWVNGLALIFQPPFDKGELSPGYIKGYVPGVRENGGQYTHAACWVMHAFSIMGEADKAYELFRMLNPINHSNTLFECNKYKIEPYVVAADVYSNILHRGRGGWSWYTGSAGWLYNVAIEEIIGLKQRGKKLIVDPCIPGEWRKYTIKYIYKSTLYEINVETPYGNSQGNIVLTLDDKPLSSNIIELEDDGEKHIVTAFLN
ncbi:Cellobiose phosphorylase [Peptoclostridium litorale DSM 5388]|uniref:Protein NdvB n=1 Tax=Peptoclostridium litorale DSM 5388 TaxID=1121324 RepID=A0A069RM37_PEPLI|nr:glucoamylase family protein [Peptoclostridium litorale]KDR95267.1 protein NdvB [Peptoclostridium litorale DSM 5388]SIN72490.1 Cellobiose phosphorylase [Peptoclostridium litorale DSM 5388]